MEHTQTTPYLEGYRTGRVDRLLNHRAEYTWRSQGLFSEGYRAGWLHQDRAERGLLNPNAQEGN